jgi:high affinity Mn2+ porin
MRAWLLLRRLPLVLALAAMPLRSASCEPLSPPDPPNAETEAPEEAPFAPERWSLHGQSTVVVQGHPRFSSPYQGANSLTPGGQVRETVTATAFLGGRLWPGAVLYVNPEIAQGFGLSKTLGIAGFPNGEATKAGATAPKIYVARLFLRQTIGFGGATEDLPPDANQLAETVDVSRLTLTVGGLAANDLFDGNAYAHDPRTGLLNWSLWESGAWDYPADARGYTFGAAADLHQEFWSVRGGFFLMPRQANGSTLDWGFAHRFGSVVELERRWELDEHPGAIRLLAYLNRARMGSYFESIAEMPADPDITASRALRSKYGFATSFEQEVTRGLGVFARLSWDDGTTETYAFTEIDRSLALGAVASGIHWGRPDDGLALAVVANGLGQQHRDYLAAGGLGFILGDGRLHAGPETIVETFYSAQLMRHLAVTVDEQVVVNPGSNQSRGPVSVTSLRIHVSI